MQWRPVVLAFTVLTALLVPTLALAEPATTTRPISDFLTKQGKICPASPACAGFLTNYFGFSGQNGTPIERTTRIAFVDFAALEGPVAAALGTSTTGTVTDRPLADGTAEVHVILHTRNALTQVLAFDPTKPFPAAFGDHWFGYTAADVLGGATPGVGDSDLDVTFINTKPGDPLPDLVGINTGDFDFRNVKMLGFRAQASGPLLPAAVNADEIRRPIAVGTQGRVDIAQSGLIGTGLRNGGKGALLDFFPAEHVDLHIVGR